MDFSSERYVRLYVRNTTSWRLLGWQGRAVWQALYREADLTGAISLHGRTPAQVAVLHGELPSDVASVGMATCLELGWLVHDGDRLTIPRYVEANEAVTSSTQRVREHRERARLKRNVSQGNGTFQNETSETDETFHVTPRVSSQAFRIGHELMFDATGRQFGLEWRGALEQIGDKPEAERRAVVPAIRGKAWCRANPTKVTPSHVLRMWADYAAGAPPMQLVSEPALAPQPTELERLYDKWSELDHARAACLFSEEAKRERITARMDDVAAQIERAKAGLNGRA